MRTLIILTAFLVGCHIDAPLPIDFPIIVEPIDTIPDPIVVDTCEAFEEIDTPIFVSFFVNLDVPLFQDSNIYYQAFPSAPTQILDPNTFFDTIFYSGINIAGIKSGTSNADQYNSVTRIWMVDGLGTRHHLSFASQALHLRGAVPCSMLKDIWEQYPSIQFLRFSNSGCTCEDLIETLNHPLEEGCFETPNIVDLRPISIGSCVIPQEIINEYILRGSTVWQ